VGLVLWLGIVIVIAETLQQLHLFKEEIFCSKRPSSRWSLQATLTEKRSPKVTILLFVSFLLICSLEPKTWTEIVAHWPLSLGIGGLYVVLVPEAKILQNATDCEVQSDDSVLPIGRALAYSYYYGFLRIILPPGQHNKSVCDRATDFECEQKIQLASKKLLVLIPESCFCHPSFQDMASGQIEKTRDLEKVVVSRAGIKGRSYSCTVYRIQPNQRKKAIFVMIEMPSILYTLYEMNTFGQHNSKLSTLERRKQAREFYHTLLGLLDNDPSCKDTYELLLCQDQDDNLAELIYEWVDRITNK